MKWARILGTNLHFNLFNVAAPVNGVLWGRSGILNVILADLILLALKPKFGLLRILLFLPMILATALYAELFRGNRKPLALAPILMVLFWLNDAGREAWPYALLWIAIVFPLFIDNLFTRALATQFFDHALGSLIFLYFAEIPAEIWLKAIPLAIMERLLMASGLAIATVVALGIAEAKVEEQAVSV